MLDPAKSLASRAVIEKLTLKIAAGTAHKVLTEYKKSMDMRHSFVSTICDSRYKLAVLANLFDAEDGTNSTNIRRKKHTSSMST